MSFFMIFNSAKGSSKITYCAFQHVCNVMTANGRACEAKHSSASTQDKFSHADRQQPQIWFRRERCTAQARPLTTIPANQQQVPRYLTSLHHPFPRKWYLNGQVHTYTQIKHTEARVRKEQNQPQRQVLLQPTRRTYHSKLQSQS